MGDGGAPSGDKDLGDFLRARRAALDRSRVGLPDDGRPRRVPGLCREEVSYLANVSVDYIVRLEQGRTRRVSRPVLDALADALQLTPDERAYLATLAEVAPATRTRAPAKPEVTPQLRQLLEDMHDIPAMVVYRRMDVLAWNRGAAALLTDFGALPPCRAQFPPAHVPRRRLSVPVRRLAPGRARLRRRPTDGSRPTPR